VGVERWLIRGPCSNWCPEQAPCIIERLVVVLCFAVALSIMHIVTVTICLSKTHLIKYVHSNPKASRTVNYLSMRLVLLAKQFPISKPRRLAICPLAATDHFCNGHFEAVGYMAKQPSGKPHQKQTLLTYDWFVVAWK